ncbi:hypothetical protein ABH944_008555 [Caballeronia udeis]|uniref:Uncharacterized protein n=1 Tax=Caballeronia udeis TaxID=1232866 RepID=A0ABW8MXK9_9BURK
MAVLNFIGRSRPVERFPLCYRLQVWQSGFRYAPAGRYLHALSKGNPWGLLMATFGVAAGALPLALCPDVAGIKSSVWTAMTSAAGLLGLVMLTLDVTLAWLVDPDWIKLHVAGSASPLMLGLSVFAAARHGLSLLSPAFILAAFAAEMWLLLITMDELGKIFARRRQTQPIFNPFSGGYCRGHSQEGA